MQKKEKIGNLKKKSNFEKKNNCEKKKEKKGKVSKKTKEKGKSTVDYCCNPQCFGCGGTVISPFNSVIIVNQR